MEAISEAVTSEVETELINASHTNVLLLRQVTQFLKNVQILYKFDYQRKPHQCTSAAAGDTISKKRTNFVQI